MPEEAVGLLGGNDGCVSVVRPLPNIGPRWTFLADPFAQYHAERALARAGAAILGIYHSHPGGGAQLSPLDIVVARCRSCVHIVVALDPDEGSRVEIRAYRVENDRVSNVRSVDMPPPA
jgi:proteasome lid subunit RPN8/RPN11